MELSPSPAVLLRTYSFADAHLVVVVLSEAHGKVRCIARGAKNSRKRFAGGLSVGMLGRVEFGRGSGELVPLQAFVSERDVTPLGRDLHAYGHACYICELCDALLPERQAEADVFRALRTTISSFLDVEFSPASVRGFELELLEAGGLLPDFSRCAVCGVDLDFAANPSVAMDPRRGCLCEEHAGTAERWPSPAFALGRDLRGALERDRAAAHASFAQLPAEIRRGLRDLLWRCLREYLSAPLASRAFLASLSHPRVK